MIFVLAAIPNKNVFIYNLDRFDIARVRWACVADFISP